MTESGAGSARGFEPWRLHGGDPLEARRRELFALAAPIFRRHGYRGATIKALAHACGLSPASLYHYFRSKEEMATYLLRRPRMDWDSTWVDRATDPLVQLRSLVDLVALGAPELPAGAAAGRRDRGCLLARRGACPGVPRGRERVRATAGRGGTRDVAPSGRACRPRRALRDGRLRGHRARSRSRRRTCATGWSQSCARRWCPLTSMAQRYDGAMGPTEQKA